MSYVISRLSSDVFYNVYKDVVGGKKEVIKKILIKGGAGVANRKTLEISGGIPTEVTEEELELLENNPVFKLHKANGHILILAKADKYEAADKAENSTEIKNDEAAQQTIDDFDEQDNDDKKTLKRKKSSKRKGK